MSDVDEGLVFLAGLHLGNGKKDGPRRVATPEGAAYYNQPIGTIITPDMIAAKRKENKSKGVKPAKGMLTRAHGGNSNKGTPSAANPSAGGSSSSSSSSGGPSSYPAAGNVHTQTYYPAPGVDSAPPKWMSSDSPNKAPKLAVAAKPSSLKGNQKFAVGNSQYSAPSGSRLIRPKNGKPVAFVVTPDNEVHAFTEAGEIEIAPQALSVFKSQFAQKLDANNPNYSEEDFESPSSTIDKMSPGEKLYDGSGNDIFTKTENGWEHSELGVPVSEDDIVSLYESGELVARDSREDSFDYGDDEDTEIAFSAMTPEEFTQYADSLDEGDELYVVSDPVGDSPQEYLTMVKKENGQWENDTGHLMESGALSFLKNYVRTIKPRDLNKAGTAHKEKKEQEIAKAKADADLAASKVVAADPSLTPEQKKEKKDKDLLDSLLADADAKKKTYEDLSGITEEKAKAAKEEKKAKAKKDADVLASEASQAVSEQDAFDAEKSSLSPEDKSGLENSALGSDVSDSFKDSALPGSQAYDPLLGETYTAKKKGVWVSDQSDVETSLPSTDPSLVVKKNTLLGEEVWEPKNSQTDNAVGSVPDNKFIGDPSAGSVIETSDGKKFFAVEHKGDTPGKTEGGPTSLLSPSAKGAKSWVSEDTPWKTEGVPTSLFSSAAKGNLKVAEPTNPNLHTGFRVSSDEDFAKVHEHAFTGTKVHVVDEGEQKSVFTLGDSGVWTSKGKGSSSTFDLSLVKQQFSPTAEFYVGHVAPESEKKRLSVGDTPDLEWLAKAPVGSAVTWWKTSLYKRDNGLWAVGDNPEGKLTGEYLLHTYPDPDFKIGEANFDAPSDAAIAPSPKKKGDIASYDDVLIAPVGTKFHYEKKDGTFSDYAKVDEDHILMPGGVIQPIGHWKNSLDKGKVSFAEDTELNPSSPLLPENAPSGDVEFPEPSIAPTGDDAKDKKSFEEAVKDTDEWEKDLESLATPGHVSSVEELDSLPDDAEVWTGSTVYVYDKEWDDYGEATGGWRPKDEPQASVISSEDLLAYGQDNDPDQFPVVMVDGKIPATTKKSKSKSSGPLTAEELKNFPKGHVVISHSDDGETEFEKTDDDEWVDPMSYEGEPYSSEQLIEFSDKVTPVPGDGEEEPAPEESLEKTVDEALKDIQEKTIGGIAPGVPAFSPLEVHEAIEALENHSHGSPVYGLKKLDDSNVIKSHQQEFIDHAKKTFPKHTAKQALILSLKGMVGENSVSAMDEVDNPTIHLGKEKPAKNSFGLTGGDFTQSDIDEAIELLESYGGKQFKSKLTQAGNPLGSLDFNTLVGPDKDKLAQKQKVIDHLKESVKDMSPFVPQSKADLDPVSKTKNFKGPEEFQFGSFLATDYDEMSSAPVGTTVMVNGVLWKKDTQFSGSISTWSNDDGESTDSEGLMDLASEIDSDPFMWHEHSHGDVIPATAEFLDSLGTGEKINVHTKSGKDFIYAKQKDGKWHRNGAGVSHQSSDFEILVEDLGATLTYHQDKDHSFEQLSVEEFDSLPEGAQVILTSPDTGHSKVLTKVNESMWGHPSGIYGNSNLKALASIGNVYLFSADGSETSVPQQYTAPSPSSPAFGPELPTSGDLLPGIYSFGDDGQKVHVYADGTGALAGTSGGVKYLDAKGLQDHIKAHPLSDAKYEVPTHKNAVPHPVEKTDHSDTPAAEFDISDLVAALEEKKHFAILDNSMGEKYNLYVEDGSIFYVDDDGNKKTLYPEIASHLAKSGQLVNIWGNTSYLLKGHDNSVLFYGNQTSTQNLKALRKALDDPSLDASFDGAHDSYMDTLVEYGVPVSQDLKKHVDSVKVEGESFRETTNRILDGILGSPDSYTDKELENVSGFDWAPGTSTAYFPKTSVPYFFEPYSYTILEDKNAAIEDIGKNFGDGQTIGQFSGVMPEVEKTKWLEAYETGNFKEMYDLEVAAGMELGLPHPSGWKHPGYPKNASTHKVTWAPAVTGEAPAGSVEGFPHGSDDWTDKQYADYLLAAGMQNPGHLTAQEKEEWAHFHALGLQSNVNALSVKAYNAAHGGEKSVSDGVSVKKPEPEAPQEDPVYSLAPKQWIKQSLHPSYNVVDQFGNKYIFKAAPEDVNGAQYRAEVEAGAGAIAKYFGSSAPNIKVETLQGKLGTMQDEVSSVASLQGFDWSSTTPTQAVDIANEHLVDWMLDQDDNWGPNSLITSDGHVVGIDKGRSFISYGKWNGLVSHSGMDVNTHLVYSDLYSAIINKKISKETADAAWRAVHRRALQMSQKDDGKLLEMLHAATDSRKKWSVDYTIDGKKVPQTQQGFFDAFFDRKAKLPEQVEALWKDIYAKAGYGDLPAPKDTYLGADQHSGLDDTSFHSTVLAVGSVGSSTLLSGSASKLGYAQGWTATDADGAKVAFTQIHLGPVTQEKVTEWFAANSAPLTKPSEDPTKFTYDTVYTPYVAAAKTISTHAVDGNYTQSTLDTYNAAKSDVKKDKDFWSPYLQPDPEGKVEFPSGAKIPYGHVDQYKMMLDYYDSKSEILDTALAEKTAPSEKIMQYGAVDLSSVPSIHTTPDGQKLVKLNNGSYLFTNGSVTSMVSGDEGDLMLKLNDDWTKWSPSGVKDALQYQAKTNGSTFDRQGTMDGFELKLGTEVPSGAYSKEYEVELPTGEKIFYRNSTKTSTVSLWQQGMLTFKAPNASDPEALSASIERAQKWAAENLGLEFGGATKQDVELTYWRRMLPILADRKHTSGSKYDKASKELSVKMKELDSDHNTFSEKFDAVASTEEQNKYFRDLWSKHFGAERVEKFLSKEGYLPRYENTNYNHIDKMQGQPIWERLDIDLDDLKAADHMLAAKSYSSQGKFSVANMGALLSAEQRLRVLGAMHGSSDQHTGGSDEIYTRIYGAGAHEDLDFIVHPRAMLRVNTRAFGKTDGFGDFAKNQSYVDSDALRSWINNLSYSASKGGPFEVDVTGTSSLFGDLEAIIFEDYEKEQLNAAVQKLKEAGIETIRGVPVEDRLILRSKMSSAIQKLKDTWYK